MINWPRSSVGSHKFRDSEVGTVLQREKLLEERNARGLGVHGEEQHGTVMMEAWTSCSKMGRNCPRYFCIQMQMASLSDYLVLTTSAIQFDLLPLNIAHSVSLLNCRWLFFSYLINIQALICMCFLHMHGGLSIHIVDLGCGLSVLYCYHKRGQLSKYIAINWVWN